MANVNLCLQGHMLKNYYGNIRIKSRALNLLKFNMLLVWTSVSNTG